MMKPIIPMKKTLSLLLFAALSAGSGNLIASPDDDDDEDRGRGDGGSEQGGGSGSRDALSANFVAIEPTAGRGDGHYFPFSGGEDTALNADVRLALEKLDDEGNTLKILNTHLGVNTENTEDVVITLFIGTDEDGDGSCLTEGPTSICVLEGGGGDSMVNDDNILHAAWAMALRTDDDDLRGSGICWSDFDSVVVEPQFTDDGVTMTSVVFNIVGGEETMPIISEDDGCMVGYGHSDPAISIDLLGFTNGVDCGPDKVCEVIPIMNGLWED
ncbi:MAG: hypothetical protein WBP02_03270 [Gammaproteobacteria bacterium]